MNSKPKKKPKLTRGTSSAVLLSILIHAGLFLLAGLLTVFVVHQVKDPEFEAPKAIERPKMKLKKPKVRTQKSSKPKTPNRITAVRGKATLPEIDLPELGGIGEGVGFDMSLGMDFDVKPSLMGSGFSIGSDLVGTFYDFKRDRSGRDIGYDRDGFRDMVRKFIKSGWKTSVVDRYYRSPRKLYATTIVVPTVLSEIAPEAFGEEVEGKYWMVHYTGQLVCHRDITFRFVGSGDEMLVVRVDHEIAMAVAWWSDESQLIGDIWTSMSGETDRYWLGNQTATMGEWITLEAGVPLDLEILVSDNGGQACFMLGIEEQGVEYPNRTIGGPIFPAFKTAELSLDQLDVIYQNMVADELNLTNGPVFSDVRFPKAARSESPEPALPISGDIEEPDDPVRTWTLADGTEFIGEYQSLVGKKAVFKAMKGKQKTLQLSDLSEPDRQYVELENPPTIKLGVSYESTPKYTIEDGSSSGVVSAYRYTYSGNAKKTSVAAYNHELTVEFFAIGSELHGDKFILLDRQQSTFIPTAENEYSVSFTGETVEMPNFILEGIHRGVEHYGYLIMVTDKRGRVIEYKTTAKWLYENLDNLRQLPVGRFMDRSCKRVFPTGPKRTRY